jgi:hypothetical protein
MSKNINIYYLFHSIFNMSLSSRWSFFSKGGVKEEGEHKEEKQEDILNDNGNDNGEEVVFSVSEEETMNVKVNDQHEHDHDDNYGEKEVKTVVESSCSIENCAESTCTESTGVNVLFKKANECYLNMRNMRAMRAVNEKNESNSHYKGFHTEVMPTMPVLYIEEFVPASYKVGSKKSSIRISDWRAYIYYDSHRCVYVLNGTRRRDNEQGTGIERKYPDTCMTFKSRSSLAFYLKMSMCSLKHTLNVTMYSMYRSVIHLTTCGAMPSFHSIHNCRTKFRTELFGYDDCHISIKKFESYLKVLKEGVDDGYFFRPTPTNAAMMV